MTTDFPSSGQSIDGCLKVWASVRKLLISVFILLYLYCVGLWLCPPAPWRDALLEPVRGMISYCGLWQSYRLFSIPRSYELLIDARIIDETGGVTVWHFPALNTLPFPERTEIERFRKLVYEYVSNDEYREFCPDFCRYLLRTIYLKAKPAKAKPAKVQLIRYWSDIPQPVGDPLSRAPKFFRTCTYFVYCVKPEDLK